MNQNPLITFERLPSTVQATRKRTLFIVLLGTAILLGGIGGSLYRVVDRQLSSSVVLFDGAPSAADRMGVNEGVANGRIVLNNIEDGEEGTDTE